MRHTDRISVSTKTPPVIEIDPSCSAVYVRFKQSAKVAKTQSLTPRKASVLCTVDFDAKGEVIGIELVGVKEFSIQTIVESLPKGARHVDFQRARFVPAASVVA